MEIWRSLGFVLVLLMAAGSGEGQLAENFYHTTCPNVEAIAAGSYNEAEPDIYHGACDS